MEYNLWITVLYTWNEYTVINQVCFNLKKKKREETRALHSTAQTKLQCVSSFLGVFVSCLIRRIWAGAQLSIPLRAFLSSLASLHHDYRWQAPTRVSLSFPGCFQGHTDGKRDKKGWVTSVKLPHSVFPPSALNCYSQAMGVLGKN